MLLSWIHRQSWYNRVMKSKMTSFLCVNGLEFIRKTERNIPSQHIWEYYSRQGSVPSPPSFRCSHQEGLFVLAVDRQTLPWKGARTCKTLLQNKWFRNNVATVPTRLTAATYRNLTRPRRRVAVSATWKRNLVSTISLLSSLFFLDWY